MELNYNYQTHKKDLKVGCVFHLLDSEKSPVAAIVIEEGKKQKIFFYMDGGYHTRRFKIDFYEQKLTLLLDDGTEEEEVWNHLDLVDIISSEAWEILVRK